VEFLVGEPAADGRRPFYFLEVNPRLQVEHPVTEMVTGLDLVELQLRVAAGEPLPFAQGEVRFDGHAVEFRVNAEDPWAGFRPSAGRIGEVTLPSLAGSRVDSGYGVGDTVPTQYDSLLAKVVVHAPTRAAALDAGVTGMSAVDFEDITTNAQLLAAVASDEAFRAGEHHVGWLEPHLDRLLDAARPPEPVLAAGALGAVLLGADSVSPFHSGPSNVYLDTARGRAHLRVRPLRRGEFDVGIADLELCCAVTRASRGLRVQVAGQVGTVVLREERPGVFVAWIEGEAPERTWRMRLAGPPPLPRRPQAAQEGMTQVRAPLAGTIAEVRVATGDAVEAGSLLLVLEAMKMEHRIVASVAGTVQAISVAAGDVVREGDVLVELA
jgi:acetyl/propionyl-CoA carboxylase alpha subunit